MAMDNHQIAERVIELVGGPENIQSYAHCATRLRLIVADKDKIDMDAVEDVDKVKGSFFNAGQYQIIFGTGLVDKVYDEVHSIIGEPNAPASEAKKEGNTFQRAIRVFGDVFVPIIPALVATGLFMGVRGLITQDAILGLFGMTSETLDPNFILFTQILTDTAFSFLPALVCWSTFRIFGGNPVLGIVIGLMLVNPGLPNAYDVGQGSADPLMFFGLIPVTGYQGSVLPAFITGIVGSFIERGLKKVIPDAIDLIVTPFLTMLSSIALALFVLGPIFHSVEQVVLVAVSWILTLPLGLGGLLYGSFGQLLGIFGIHHVLNFLEINMLASTGWNMLNPIGTCGNLAQAGAVLAVAIKAKSNKMKQVAYPSALSATLGITEPAVFGVTLRLVKPFVCAMIGGGVGGFLASILGLRATGMALTGIPGTLLYLNEQLPWYIVCNLVAMGVAFALTFVFGYQETASKDAEIPEAIETPSAALAGTIADPANDAPTAPQGDVVLNAAVSGQVIPLSQVKDEVFSAGILGKGVAIIPTEGKVKAPCDGVICAAPDTKHAIGITGPNNVEVLVHVGMDTVELNGKYFDMKVHQGDVVHAGDTLLEFDMDQITKAGYELTTPMVVTNAAGYGDPTKVGADVVQSGDELLKLSGE